MQNVNRMSSAPLSFPRSVRRHDINVLTSLPAGKCVPVAAIPLLREDAASARVSINVEMLETKEILMNRVNLRVTAFLVPLLALERFEGSRDQFDRSYMGQPKVEGGAVVPFIETHDIGTHGSKAVYKYLGLHGKSGDLVNTAYLEAYNRIWNFRAKNRSPNLSERTRLDATLAKAFWQHSRFAHIVPDFDQAVIDGEVALNVVNADLNLRGTRLTDGFNADRGPVYHYLEAAESSGRQLTIPNNSKVPELVGSTNTSGSNKRFFSYLDLDSVVAEIAEGGISLSLSNLELARKTQAFAKLRERYEEHDDEWIIDMLMDGLTIPEQALKNPILLADKTVSFAQSKRYATDAGNLSQSAVSGATALDLSIRVPRLNTGGVIMVIAEAVPEQLFERQRDPFFYSADVNAWPEALRDTLDPEKVDIVKMGEIDTAHATPNNTFGYAPMNWRWNAAGPKVGGKFYRPSTDTPTDDVRQRLWAVEAANPTLSADFYVVSSIHTKPFLDTAADPFELAMGGAAMIEGNTQFGGLLVEATGNYDKVLDKAPMDRIDK